MIDSLEKTLLIVAGGESVLKNEYGNEIDVFDTVGRINNYRIAGFKEYVGTKTDIWFNGANQGLKKRADIPERVIVLIPAEILKRKGESIHQRICTRLGVDREDYELVPRSDILEYESHIGVKRPTTGTSSILWGIDHFETVVIHGFDFFIDTKSHYNDNVLLRWLVSQGRIKKAGKHDMQQEKKYVESLIEKGAVVQLKDYL